MRPQPLQRFLTAATRHWAGSLRQTSAARVESLALGSKTACRQAPCRFAGVWTTHVSVPPPGGESCGGCLRQPGAPRRRLSGSRNIGCEAECQSERALVELASRTLVEVSGPDAVLFLQGLLTCDVQSLGPDCPASHAMMLNVQGRVLYDLMLYVKPSEASVDPGPAFLLECALEVKDELLKLLKLYKIRKKVMLVDRSAELHVLAAVDEHLTLTSSPVEGTVCVPDPRVPQFGQRFLVPGLNPARVVQGEVREVGEEHYHEKRYRWGIAEGTTDLPPGRALPLESNLVFTNGVSFTKGCYIGQELTARTHHTGVTRKRLMPLVFERPPEGVAAEETIHSEHQRGAGKLRGWKGVVGLGLMRMANVGGKLSLKPQGGEGPISLSAHVPPWWPSQQ